MRGADHVASGPQTSVQDSLRADETSSNPNALTQTLTQTLTQPIAVNPLVFEMFMGLDYGTKRIGVAYGHKLLASAKPCRAVSGTALQQWAQIGQLIAQYQPEALVVGVPFHPDGAEHENTIKARRFIRQLRGRFSLPVFEVDERYSTTEVHSAYGGDTRRVDVDSESACVILNQFFRSLSV